MSHRAQVLEALHKALPDLRERFGVQEVWLFGSFARAEDKPDSDVNVLVELPPGATLFTLSRIKHSLEELLKRDVDVGTSGGLSRVARERVLKESVRVA
jgi:predicted nucleotidyltransferase